MCKEIRGCESCLTVHPWLMLRRKKRRFIPNNYCTLPKTINSTDFSASERSDIGLMLELFYVFMG